jgi:hypothetical protein
VLSKAAFEEVYEQCKRFEESTIPYRVHVQVGHGDPFAATWIAFASDDSDWAVVMRADGNQEFVPLAQITRVTLERIGAQAQPDGFSIRVIR